MTTTGLVWVTRAEPGAGETAKRLRTLGYAPVVEPLLTVRPLPAPPPDLSDAAALAFTSANGVRAFSERTTRRDLPVFTVGEATAAAAVARGFRVVAGTEGGVADLGALITAHPAAQAGRVLHPTAREPAGDLVGRLRRSGLRAEALVVYETVAAETLAGAIRRALADDAVRAILIHSPRGARTLAALLRSDRLAPKVRRVHLLALSLACLEPLATLPFASRRAAPRPTDAALLALLGADLDA